MAVWTSSFILDAEDGLVYLKTVFVHQDDGLKGGASFVGQLVERLLSTPALLLQRVAHHAGGVVEAGAEVEHDIGARFGATATRQINLKPAGRGHTWGVTAQQQPEINKL